MKKHLKIVHKIFLAMLGISMILILSMGGIFERVSVWIMYKNMKDLTSEFIEQISCNLENQTENLLDTTYEFMVDAELKNLVRNAKNQVRTEGIYKYRQEVKTLGSRHFSTSSPVSAVYVFDGEENAAWWVKLSRDFYYGDITEAGALNLADQARNQMTGITRNTCWFINPEDGWIYLARNLIDTDQNFGDVYGLVLFKIDGSFFDRIQSENMMITNTNLVFRNHASHMVYTSEQNRLMAQTYIKEQDGKSGDYVEVLEYENETYVFAGRVKNSLRWDVFCFLPESVFLDKINVLRWMTLAIAGFAVFVSLILAYVLSKNLTRTVLYLEKNMRKVENGDFHVHVEPTSFDEIGMLCRQFNCMADKIEDLIEDAYEAGQTKEKLKFQVLKAQINPHFLYNSLGSIRCMARMKQEEDIAKMTAALIDLLRASLSKNGEFHPVSEEIDYIKNYFVLQRYRYEDSFCVSYEIEEETTNLIMPDFILQPLVENALFHGIEISSGNGKIKITSAVINHRLRLTVEDNGIGMTREKIAEILSYQEEKYEGLNSIGVSNVSMRIKHLFGEEYGLSYISEVGQGSIAEIWLPVFRTMEEVKAFCIKS